jgi:predicted extracellular nuclease
VVNIASYDRVELPKLSPNQKPRLFSRGPLELQIIARARETGTPKAITLVNFHMKSQRGGKDDPAALEWETYRMEMAEGLRRIVERRHKQSFASAQSSLILLGDRNSNFDVASARIIEGVVTLESFRVDGACRLSKRGVPLCKTATLLPQRLFSVLTTNPRTKSLPGTYLYQGEYSWLDDILVPAESLPLVWRTDVSENDYESGVVYTPDTASDHALVFVRLNWF